MRSASVLVVTLRGLAAEVCKNVVLAGIGKLTILDDKDISEEDLGANFFLREEEIGQKVGQPRYASKMSLLAIHAMPDEGALCRLHPCHTYYLSPSQRVSAAKARINALNPRVEIIASTRMEDLHDEAALQAYDLIVLTDSDRDTIVSPLFPSGRGDNGMR